MVDHSLLNNIKILQQNSRMSDTIIEQSSGFKNNVLPKDPIKEKSCCSRHQTWTQTKHAISCGHLKHLVKSVTWLLF